MINPLPIRLGLNPTRARVSTPLTAAEFVGQLISEQRHRDPADDATALLQRFSAGEVRLDSGEILRPDYLFHLAFL